MYGLVKIKRMSPANIFIYAFSTIHFLLILLLPLSLYFRQSSSSTAFFAFYLLPNFFVWTLSYAYSPLYSPVHNLVSHEVSVLLEDSGESYKDIQHGICQNEKFSNILKYSLPYVVLRSSSAAEMLENV